MLAHPCDLQCVQGLHHLVFREPDSLDYYSSHFPVDPDEQMLTQPRISKPVSRSDQDRNAKTTNNLPHYNCEPVQW